MNCRSHRLQPFGRSPQANKRSAVSGRSGSHSLILPFSHSFILSFLFFPHFLEGNILVVRIHLRWDRGRAIWLAGLDG
jgi:hypothetical protein